MSKITNDYFFYFAYGTNLYKKRILINNPSARFAAIGHLEHHMFEFAKFNTLWQGAVCTIVPIKNEVVWGAVWKMNKMDIPALDKQEGVSANEYFAKTVDISANSTTVSCRTYEHLFKPKIIVPLEKLPESRRPSISYLNCLIAGAIECNLPMTYINKLKKIPHKS